MVPRCQSLLGGSGRQRIGPKPHATAVSLEPVLQMMLLGKWLHSSSSGIGIAMPCVAARRNVSLLRKLRLGAFHWPTPTCWTPAELLEAAWRDIAKKGTIAMLNMLRVSHLHGLWVGGLILFFCGACCLVFFKHTHHHISFRLNRPPVVSSFSEKILSRPALVHGLVQSLRATTTAPLGGGGGGDYVSIVS